MLTYETSKEHGLQCFDGHQACEVEPTKKEKRAKELTQAFKELKTALRSVCESHKLPLAMTWVPCSDCNGLQRCKVYSAGVEFCLPRDSFLGEFLKVSKCRHLRKGLVAERAHSSLNMLYCSDITQLSLHEYPLVHHARWCNLSGWFTICLLCEHTGNYIYVLEFFLSARNKNDENIVATLSAILGTIEEKFKTFRFASGKVLGELTSVEVIDFQNNQKNQFVQSIQAARDFSLSSIPSSVQSSASVANIRPGSQHASMGTINANYDHPFPNFDLSFDSDPSFAQSSTSVAYTRPGFQNSNMVIIIAKYASSEEEFELSLPCRLEELQQEVTERLMLEAGNYSVTYEDEEDGRVLIGCDEDLQTYVEDSMSQGNAAHVVRLELKEPATNLNPTN
ncbi:hypothetical protein Vadar_019265 [Vaccinium darrowii]|uniref:Uncharacterized protein n=1 Tax=Vaccinium darrowii TaxID=229202 RepID=A0ACB7XJS7_9ERIC|nr:hypothetical protein Vadar_019265 [Vaccinium darrowii]